MDEWKREELLNEELKQQLEKKVKRRGRMIVLTCVLCALIVLSLLFLLCCQLVHAHFCRFIENAQLNSV